MPILLETTPNVDIELLEERHQHFVRLIGRVPNQLK